MPLNLFAGRAGTVATAAPQVLCQRFGLSSEEAVTRAVAVLRDLLDVRPEAITVTGDRVEVVLDPTSSRLLELRPSMTVLTVAGHHIRESAPRIRVERQDMDWSAFSREVGADAALWAALAGAGRREPWTVTSSLDILASRTDDNPLALLRRAHAALSGRGKRRREQSDASGMRPHPDRHPDPSAAAVAVALFLADRAAYDATRTGRTRPLTSALDDLARTAVHYLEATPVTRTELPLSDLARTVLAEALDAAGLAAPVPY